MRIHILSDLHLEFGGFAFPDVEADLVVLAGDTHVKRNGLRWVKETISHLPVLYLLGNHEYYGARFPRLVEKLKEFASGSNITVLEEDAVEIGGYRFFGSTLWTDMALFGDARAGSAEALVMNDYRRVRKNPGYRKLRPIDTRFRHESSRKALTEFLIAGDSDRSIVLSHHAPSAQSLPDSRKTELISCAYASHLDDLIVEHEPLLWVHGHIHHSRDYRIGRTRVLANPRGYVDEPNPEFDPCFVVDLAGEYQQR